MSDWPIDILPLIERLAQEKPIEHGLSVGLSHANNWPGEWQHIPLTTLENMAFTKRYDMAVIGLATPLAATPLHYEDSLALNNPEHVGKLDNQAFASLTHSLTRLRDLLARRVLVLAHADFTQLLRALGFSQIEQLPESQLIIWQFNILSYKQIPDWLNSKFWANPENWGKFRW